MRTSLKLSILYFCAIYFLTISVSLAQNPDDKNWSSSFGLPGLSGGSIGFLGKPMAIFNDTIYIGCKLYESGQNILAGVYKWDGATMVPLNGKRSPTFGDKDQINSIAIDSLGNIFIGGEFDSVDGKPAKNIAMWDGKTWSGLGEGLSNAVYDITCTKKEMYVGGVFDSAGSVLVHHIAKWDGKTWSALGNGAPHASPYNIVCIDSFVYFHSPQGGYRLDVWNGTSYDNIDTHFRRSMLDIQVPDSEVAITSICKLGSDLFVCGSFDSVDGIYAPRIAKWDGSTWSRVGEYNVIRKYNDRLLTIQEVEGKIYVQFHSSRLIIDGDTATHGAVWDGVKWKATKNELITYPYGLVGKKEILYRLSGENIQIDSPNVSYNSFCEIKGETLTSYYNDTSQKGLTWSGFIPSITNVGNRMYLFTNALATGTILADQIMIWENGQWSKTDFYDSVRSTIDGKINGLYGKGDSLFIYGSFDHFGKQKTDGVVMFDGKKWNYYSSNQKSDVHSFAVDGQGNIFRDDFLTWDGAYWIEIPHPEIPENFIPTYGSIIGADTGIYMIISIDSLSLSSGTRYSSIQKFDGSSWQSITDRNSMLWVSFNPLKNKYTTSPGIANFIAYHDRKLVISGFFSSIEGTSALNIAWLDSTGWHPFGKGIYYNSSPYRITSCTNMYITDIAFNGSDMYVTGGFSHADSSFVSSIAHWDGQNWQPIGSGLGNFDRFVFPNLYKCGCGNGIEISNGKLFVAGNFNRAGNKPAYNFSYYTLPEKNAVRQFRQGSNQPTLSLHPDPANTVLTITPSTDIEIEHVEIIDVTGHMVMRLTPNSFIKNGRSLRLDIRELSSGVYIAQVYTKNGINQAKFSVSK